MSYIKYLQGDKTEEIKQKYPKKITAYDKFVQSKNATLRVGETKKDVTVSRPVSFSDVEGLIVKMRADSGLVVDFSESPADITQRMLDFLAGAVYALEGNIEKLSRTMYLLTPKGINIIAKV